MQKHTPMNPVDLPDHPPSTRLQARRGTGWGAWSVRCEHQKEGRDPLCGSLERQDDVTAPTLSSGDGDDHYAKERIYISRKWGQNDKRAIIRKKYRTRFNSAIAVALSTSDRIIRQYHCTTSGWTIPEILDVRPKDDEKVTFANWSVSRVFKTGDRRVFTPRSYSMGTNAEYQACRAYSAASLTSMALPRMRRRTTFRATRAGLWSFKSTVSSPE